MKYSRKLLALILVVVTLLALFPAECLAAYKVKTLTLGQWYTLPDYTGKMVIYKMKVPEDSVYIVSWKKLSSDHFAYGAVNKDKACNNTVAIFLGSGKPASGSEGIALYKGTYYIKMYDTNEEARVKITSKPVSQINKENYSVSRAQYLGKNKKVEFAQMKKENYTRWYRIKLTTSQPITIYGYDGYYELYDSNFNEIRCDMDYSTDTITTDGALTKGTYYLALRSYISSLLKKGEYHKIYWK